MLALQSNAGLFHLWWDPYRCRGRKGVCQSFPFQEVRLRVVSFLPCATEIACEAGLQKALVGISHECDYPAAVQVLPRVTVANVTDSQSSQAVDAQVRELMASGKSLYAINQEALEQLQPDLVLTQGLCDVCAVAEEDVRGVLDDIGSQAKLISLNPMSLEGVLESIQEVAMVAGSTRTAEEACQRLESRVARVREESAQRLERTTAKQPRVLFLEWLSPPFSAGHWNPQLVEFAGGQVLLAASGERSREVNWQEIEQVECDVLILSSCGHAVQRVANEAAGLLARPELREQPAVRNQQVWAIDGAQYFNRPGPRLVDSLEILADILHPWIDSAGVIPSTVDSRHAGVCRLFAT